MTTFYSADATFSTEKDAFFGKYVSAITDAKLGHVMVLKGYPRMPSHPKAAGCMDLEIKLSPSDNTIERVWSMTPEFNGKAYVGKKATGDLLSELTQAYVKATMERALFFIDEGFKANKEALIGELVNKLTQEFNLTPEGVEAIRQGIVEAA